MAIALLAPIIAEDVLPATDVVIGTNEMMKSTSIEAESG